MLEFGRMPLMACLLGHGFCSLGARIPQEWITDFAFMYCQKARICRLLRNAASRLSYERCSGFGAPFFACREAFSDSAATALYQKQSAAANFCPPSTFIIRFRL